MVIAIRARWMALLAPNRIFGVAQPVFRPGGRLAPVW
jgi:hypothetical protein